MNRDDIIDLTNKLYRLTLSFPKKEPLRYKMRETADEILADFVILKKDEKSDKGLTSVQFEDNLAILKSYFEVAKWQNWASYFDVLELEEKYDRIETEFCFFAKEDIPEVIIEPAPAPFIEKEQLAVVQMDRNVKSGESVLSQDFFEPEINQRLDFRKEKILGLLKDKGKLQVWEASKILPGVSKRTLRRDFVQLLELGLIERIGESNETFYKLKT